jgi:hypothetical protein
MKKILTIVALFVAFKATAQLGFKTFASASWAGIKEKNLLVGQKQYVDGNKHFSFSAGFSYDFRINRTVYFAPEILFSSIKLSTTLRERISFDKSILTFGMVKTYNIVEVPLLFKVKGHGAYAMGGLNLMMPLTGDMDIYTNVSAGIRIFKNFNLEARYNHGLLKFNAEGYHNNRLSIGLGYIIRNSHS